MFNLLIFIQYAPYYLIFLCIIIPFFSFIKAFSYFWKIKGVGTNYLCFTNSNSKSAFRIPHTKPCSIIRLYAGRTPDMPRHRHYACCLTRSSERRTAHHQLGLDGHACGRLLSLHPVPERGSAHSAQKLGLLSRVASSGSQHILESGELLQPVMAVLRHPVSPSLNSFMSPMAVMSSPHTTPLTVDRRQGSFWRHPFPFQAAFIHNHHPVVPSGTSLSFMVYKIPAVFALLLSVVNVKT